MSFCQVCLFSFFAFFFTIYLTFLFSHVCFDNISSNHSWLLLFTMPLYICFHALLCCAAVLYALLFCALLCSAVLCWNSIESNQCQREFSNVLFAPCPVMSALNVTTACFLIGRYMVVMCCAAVVYGFFSFALFH